MTVGSPFDWNAVVAAAWNPAILTPEGIAKRLFQLQSGTPVDVQIPLTGRGPIRVTYQGTTVEPSAQRLMVIPAEPTADALIGACALASRAIESLSQTPFGAAGVNLRYRFDPLPDEVLGVTKSVIDRELSAGNFMVVGRSLKRVVRWNEGVLNLEVQEDESAGGTLLFNFHRESNDGNELRAWLEQSARMVADTHRLLADTLKVKVKDARDE